MKIGYAILAAMIGLASPARAQEGMNYCRDETYSIVNAADLDGDGSVDRDEFNMAYSPRYEEDFNFNDFDRDGDGFIDIEDCEL
jgi:Ca2+-binding EF-hand superfamily protein